MIGALSSLSGGDAVRAVGAALSLVLHRYGVPATVELQTAGGAVVASRHLADPATQRLGSINAAALSRGPQPACAVAVVNLGEPAEPLRLRLTVESGRVVAEATGESNRSLVAAGSVAAHVEHVLDVAAKRPHSRFDEVDILSDAERRLLMEDFNGERVRYRATTLHAMFAEQAARTPEAVAIVDGGVTMTYRRLDEASNQVAHGVRRFVSRAGQPVLVVAPRTAATLTVKVGVMKAGAAFVYVDPALPASRAAAICAVADPVAVVASRSAPRPQTGAPLLELEALVGAGPTTAIEEIADESTAAYVLFTSGSTGEPKGVVRPHRMNTTRIQLEQRLYGLGSDDRHLLKAVPFHRESFWGLATGGTLVLARPGGERDDAYLLDLLRRERVTVASFVPSMLRVLLRHPGFRAPDLALRDLFVAGEVIHPELEVSLRARGFAVHVTYTLAEADYVTHRTGPLDADGPADVGRPIDMRVYVCDAERRLCPPGLVGEILAGGPGLADGYANRPELTAERFIPNPFDPEVASVLFRTGDLGRFVAGGRLEFVGRADGQVKVRGQRVEPTEVEHAMRRHRGVEDVLVSGIPDADQGHVLVAYVVRRGGEGGVDGLRAFLLEHLPSYMVPSYIVPVADLPLLGTGKVDRTRLATQRSSRPSWLGPAEEPVGELEHRVTCVWQRVLGLDIVGVDDAFLELGGDSLKALLLRAALEEELAGAVPLAMLMRCPTVRGLCEALREVEAGR